MQEIGKFNQKTNVVPNGLERYIIFMLRENFIFVLSI